MKQTYMSYLYHISFLFLNRRLFLHAKSQKSISQLQKVLQQKPYFRANINPTQPVNINKVIRWYEIYTILEHDFKPLFQNCLKS